jgi:thymidylate synthase (FAD)
MPSLNVQVVGHTEFFPPTGVEWTPDDCDGGEALAEFAGRACYQSWNRPNPATATNVGYLRHILEVGHLSVLEHGNVSFYVQGVSRALTHELVRHRHLSFSQLSQRYVNESHATFVEPRVFANDQQLRDEFRRATASAQESYDALVERLNELLRDEPDRTRRRKLARQAARYVLPNATETKLVVTGNYRAWRHFVALRATIHADNEIREFAIHVLLALQGVAPNVFDDFTVTELGGVRVASSPYTTIS